MNPQEQTTQPTTQTPAQAATTLTLISCRANGQPDRTQRTVRFVMNTDSFQVVDVATGDVVYQNTYNAVIFSAVGSGKRPIMHGTTGTAATKDMLLFELLPEADTVARKAAWVQLAQDLKQHGMVIHSRVDDRSYWLRSVENAQRTFPFILLIVLVLAASPVMGFGGALFWGVIFAAIVAAALEVLKRVLRKRAAARTS